MKKQTSFLNKLIRLLPLVLLTLLFVSCESLFGNLFNKDDDKNSDTEVVTLSLSYIGRGYDVFDVYADSTYIKSKILDFDAMNAAGILERTNEENSTTYTMNGESFDSYLSSYNVETGISADYAAFSGTLAAKFGSASISTSTTSFCTYSSSVRKYKEKVINQYAKTSTLQSYVTSDAALALNNCQSVEDAYTLFSDFGTHVIIWDYIGARIDYHATSSSSSYSSASSFSSDVAANFNGLSTSASYSSESASESFKSKASTQLQIYGGPSQYANSILAGDFSSWEEGVSDSETWTLCDFGQDATSSSLIPIWELCTDQDSKAIIEEAFATWAQDRTYKVTSSSVTGYTVTLKPDYVWVRITDDGSEVEFYGKITAEDETLWLAKITDLAVFDASEDVAVKTTLDCDAKTFSFDNLDDILSIKIDYLTEKDNLSNDTYTTPSKSYKISTLIGYGNDVHLTLRAYDESDQDDEHRITFYISLNVQPTYN